MDNSHEMNPQNPSEETPQQVVPKRRLGRGLDALLGGGGPSKEPRGSEENEPTVSGTGVITDLPLNSIQRNPNQPRTFFDRKALDELAESIRIHGVLQPVLVREYGDNYELIAGERRWLAAGQAGLSMIPCRVVDVIDKIACEFAFEENLKRRDLGDLEKAQGFRNYIDHYESSVDELARQLSMSRSNVANLMRLLELPVPVKNALQEEKLTAGHARALLALKTEDEQIELAERIQKEQLSVRKTEAMVNEAIGRPAKAPKPADSHETPSSSPDASDAEEKPELSNHLKSVQEQLQASLGLKVDLKLKTKDSGQVVLHFNNQDQFELILESLQTSPHAKAA